MADKKKRKKTKKEKKHDDIVKKKDFIKDLRIAYRGLENPKKFYTKILLPLIIMGIIIFLMPFILNIISIFCFISHIVFNFLILKFPCFAVFFS